MIIILRYFNGYYGNYCCYGIMLFTILLIYDYFGYLAYKAIVIFMVNIL
jgi:hypothetical protein